MVWAFGAKWPRNRGCELSRVENSLVSTLLPEELHLWVNWDYFIHKAERKACTNLPHREHKSILSVSPISVWVHSWCEFTLMAELSVFRLLQPGKHLQAAATSWCWSCFLPKLTHLGVDLTVSTTERYYRRTIFFVCFVSQGAVIWIRNVPCKLTYLNTWSQDGGTVWRRLEGMVLAGGSMSLEAGLERFYFS